MLVGSGVRLNGGPFRNLGAALVNVTDRANWGTPGTLLNIHAGDASRVSGTSVTNKNGYPSGTRHPASWSMGIKPGAMASRKVAVGRATMTASIAGGKNATVTFAGSSTMAALGQLVVSGAVTFAGSGSMTANIQAALNAAVTFTGGSSMAAAIRADGFMAATFAGSSTASVVPYATGTMSVTFSSAVTAELTAPAIAAEVLDVQLVETGMTVRETLRLIAAATGGRVSGADTSTITIRAAKADHKVRVTATTDEFGNRSSVTTDLA